MNDWLLRTRMMLGGHALEKLSLRHVAVVGLGGVGSYASEALARSGVGVMTIIDCDTVSLSNINRQLCALRSTIGKNKTDVIAERLNDINPELRVNILNLCISGENQSVLFDLKPDFIVDAIDTVSSKLELICFAKSQGIPIISALGTGNKKDPSRFQISDISKTRVCPLARIIRRELRVRGVFSHRVLWSDEPPCKPLPLESPRDGRRSVPASVSWVPPVAGLMLAGDVILALTES